MFKFTLQDIVVNLLKLYQNNVKYNRKKWLWLLNKIMVQLLIVSQSKRRKIFTFVTVSGAVEYIHQSYLTNIAETQLFPIQKIIHALKMQYHCGYTSYTKSNNKKSSRKKSQPISIPPLPTQPATIKPKHIFKNAIPAVYKNFMK
eukprot:376757_1